MVVIFAPIVLMVVGIPGVIDTHLSFELSTPPEDKKISLRIDAWFR